MSKPVYGSATAEMSLSSRLVPQAVFAQPGALCCHEGAVNNGAASATRRAELFEFSARRTAAVVPHRLALARAVRLELERGSADRHDGGQRRGRVRHRRGLRAGRRGRPSPGSRCRPPRPRSPRPGDCMRPVRWLPFRSPARRRSWRPRSRPGSPPRSPTPRDPPGFPSRPRPAGSCSSGRRCARSPRRVTSRPTSPTCRPRAVTSCCPSDRPS